MKRLLAFIIVMTMSIALCGCSNFSPSKETKNGGSSASGSAVKNEEGDLKKVKERKKLVVGINDFEPMDYKDSSGEWVGFDADMAKEFASSLGVDVEFVEIEWDNKIHELDSGSIDCVWNGMTLTDEVKTSMSCTDAYCNNAQIVIVPKDEADLYKDVESVKKLKFAVETGSAGEKEAKKRGLKYTAVTNQSNALMEVSAGTSDAAIIDSLMAAAMVGEGTSFEKLTYTVSLNSEEYAVGFRKGSNLTEKLNKLFKEYAASGKLEKIAAKYGVQAALAIKK